MQKPPDDLPTVPLPTAEQLVLLIDLRDTIVARIKTGSRTAKTTEEGNVVRLVPELDPVMHHRAVATALKAVACVSGDISKYEFLRLAAEAYQLKIDEEDDPNNTETWFSDDPEG